MLIQNLCVPLFHKLYGISPCNFNTTEHVLQTIVKCNPPRSSGDSLYDKHWVVENVFHMYCYKYKEYMFIC